VALTPWIVRTAQKIVAIFVGAVLLVSCKQPAAREPVTLSYFRLGWSQPDELPTAEPLARQFIQETGIHLKNLPVPETTLDQLDLSRRLLESGTGPDVLGVDLIWSGALSADLLDLRPYFAEEISSLEPRLLPSYTVDGKLVAIPYSVQIGVLEYRTDLLRAYGYDHPPKTWDELERMALRIQNGERAKGRKDFWGYVWQGAAAEALTCNALEWQASEGGGRIIEDDDTISVNNAAAVRSWERARNWIGKISPPAVVAYRELDTINVFDSGGAVFNRVWGGTTITRKALSRELHWRSSLAEGKTGYTTIPGGAGGWAGTLGGAGLAVGSRSGHAKEAIELVRFLVRAEMAASGKADDALAGNSFEVQDKPESHRGTSATGGGRQAEGELQSSSVVNRPSSETGAKYEQVTRAYIAAVHGVLTRKVKADVAARELEKELDRVTGFRTGPPKGAE
jgi:trehalose/maltose transport system substrate-binding protein